MATAGSKEARQLEQVKRKFDKAYREMSKTTTREADSNLNTEADSVKFSISPNYEADFDNWFNTTNEEERRKDGGEITIGTTPAALLPLGVKDGKFVMGKSKIQKILDDHSEMTPDLIKSIPNMIENPIIVLQSLTQKKSVVVYGELLTANKNPIMASLKFTERKNGKYVAELIVLTSAYAKSEFKKKGDKGADQYLIDNSRVLYVNPDKKITDNWLKSLGLQLPSDITNYGYINKIVDFGDDVKFENSTMADAFKKAQAKKIDAKFFCLTTKANS